MPAVNIKHKYKEEKSISRLTVLIIVPFDKIDPVEIFIKMAFISF